MHMTRHIDPKENQVMDPKKFNLWLAIAGSVMLFAGLTSAYIVRRAEGNWNSFDIPDQFIYSTIIVVLSSFTIQWAWFSARKDEINQTKIGLWTTLILGLGFLYSQFLGWESLVKLQLFFSGDDVASSFFYVITAFHFLHVVGGLIAMIRALVKTYRLEIHKTNMRTISMCTTYWHFMGILWIYLYLFLFLNR